MEHQQRKPSVSSTQVPADWECSDSRVRVQLVVEDKHQENHVAGLHSEGSNNPTEHWNETPEYRKFSFTPEDEL